MLVLAMFASLGAIAMAVEEGAPTGLSPNSGMDRQGLGVRERGTGVKAGESQRDQREPRQGQDKGGLAQKLRRLNERGWERA